MKKIYGLLIALSMFSTVSFSLNNNEKVEMLKEAKKQIGKEYLYGAKAMDNRKFDCSSFVMYLYNKEGRHLPRTSREQAKLGVRVKNLQVGDLLFFRHKGKTVSHVGMYIGNNKFVHASSAAKKVTVSELKGYYSSHFLFAKRFK